MSTLKRVFTLRLTDDIFDKITQMAKDDHRSVTNLIEFILMKYIEEAEDQKGKNSQTAE